MLGETDGDGYVIFQECIIAILITREPLGKLWQTLFENHSPKGMSVCHLDSGLHGSVFFFEAEEVKCGMRLKNNRIRL